MAKSTRATLSMISARAKANLLGKMAAFTMECGVMENSTVEENSSQRTMSRELENGKTGRRSDGSLELKT